MKTSHYLKLFSALFLLGISLSLVFALIHSCGSGFYLDPRTIVTATPTPIPPGEEVEYDSYAVSWTDGIDFSDGEFDGIEPTESGNGLQLGIGGQQDFKPTQICVAAASANQVWLHKLDDPTQSITVTLPQFSGSSGSISPSRTAIDKDGNCWVGGRENGGVYKISKEGEIIGKVQLFADMNNPVDDIYTRGVAIDKNGFVWVGDTEHQILYKLSPGEDINGNLIVVGGPYPAAGAPATQPGPYGAAVDSEGNLWVTGYDPYSSGELSPGFISKLDTNTGNVLCTMKTDTYGLVIGPEDYPYTGGWDAGTFNKIKKDCSGHMWQIDIDAWTISHEGAAAVSMGDEETMLGFNSTNSHTRGVGLDTEGNLWVADSHQSQGWVYKFDKDGNYLGKVTTRGDTPIGVSGDPSTDSEGNSLVRIWAVNQGTNNIARISGKDISPTGDNASRSESFPTGNGPYTYSDMVGFGLFTTVLQNSGTWKVNFDSGYDEPHWKSVSWRAKVNETTQVRVRARTAATEEDLALATYTQYFDVSPADIEGLTPDQRWIQIEVYFYTLDQTYSPMLEDLSLNFELPTGGGS